MATVKEFRDLGVEFVKGDEGETFHVHYAEGFNRPKSCFNGDKVTCFVWRDGDGGAPAFSGIVEFTFNGEGCEMQECRQRENINWSIVKKWRPSLDQSGEKSGEPTKPVFTQAMADIKVGFKLKFNHDINGKFKHLHDERYGWEDGDNLEVIHITKNHDGEVCFIVLNCQEDVLTTAAIIDTSFFDTRTPKQKAVDDALELIGFTNEGEVAIHLGQVYDLWHK